MSVTLSLIKRIDLSWFTGPIFDKELRVSSRRQRNYWLRFFYVAMLGFILTVFWIEQISYRGSFVYRVSRMAEMGIQVTCFLVWFAVFVVAFGLSGDLKMHLAAVMVGVFAMFARPEALVLLVPLMLWPFAKRPLGQWRKVAFWIPVSGLIAAMAVRVATLRLAPDSPDSFLTWAVDWSSLHQNLGTWIFGLSRVSFALLLLIAMGIAAKPWRKDVFRFGLFAAWFLVAFVIYFHVDQTEAFQGGRLSLVMLPPMAYMAGEGAGLLVNLKHRQRWWALAIVVIWLLATPVLHWNTMQRDYKATYQQNFLFEA